MLHLRQFAFAVGALAFGTGLGAPAWAQELTPVRFTLDWRIEGPAAGFMLAEANGYFEEEGLDVTFDVGNGSVDVIPRVATGAYDMGFGDINSLIKFLDEDASQPIKAIMMIYETPTFSIVGRRSLGITDDPASLEGKTLGARPPDGAFAQWPAFVEASGIDTSDITIESIGFPVREPMLAQGDVDAVFGFAFSVILNLKAQGVPDDDIVPIMMADHGLDLYGNAIMVNTNFAAENPEVVQGMLRALTKGFADAVADPAAGAEAVVAANDILDVAIETERLTMANEMNIYTPYVQENGFGGVDMERLDASIEQLGTSIGISSDISAADVFDDSFLPPAEERMFN
ncbi:ABC transporter substrate-binding protein [Pelagibacterium sp. 26DY04]|uniref:ABC transporter substrate-binding protein n=1 Tax=Pelagibacterium sp. 26DY04 TaxID=2967130 RepID=UPI002815A0AB|nr:ABC transporter substrate-binding protein [Pelagibacterium sp. 26DY04]WMT87663.1 ABC transporter substrate-binding protein [Pelagibacterium sp. 26DY04]